MNLAIPTNEADTLGGLIFNRIGRVPKVGDIIKDSGTLFTVAEIHERRVNKVLAEFKSAEKNPELSEADSDAHS